MKLLKHNHIKKIIMAALASLIVGCSNPTNSIQGENMQTQTNKSTFVLIHSAWQGGWSWGYVSNFLEETGHIVIAPDLPGHGQDKTPASDVTMKKYVKTITDILDQQSEPVILVGHSFGGIVASQVAETRPEKVKALVYFSAFLLPDGVSFMDATKGVSNSMVLNNLVMSEDGSSVTIKEDAIHDAVAHDVPLEAFLQAKPYLVAEPTAPLATPLALTDARWGSVPRYYIESIKDNAIPPAVQKQMYTQLPVKQVFTLETSHAANFSAPDKVAAYLNEVATIETKETRK